MDHQIIRLTEDSDLLAVRLTVSYTGGCPAMAPALVTIAALCCSVAASALGDDATGSLPTNKMCRRV